MQSKNRNEKYPIGTKVIILKDCRYFKRAEGKIGVIHKIDHRIIPKETFPLEFTVKKQKVRLNITDLEDGDLILNIPIIKYRKVFGKIKGDRCYWHSIDDLLKDFDNPSNFQAICEANKKIRKQLPDDDL